jgi:hypothetical protein
MPGVDVRNREAMEWLTIYRAMAEVGLTNAQRADVQRIWVVYGYAAAANYIEAVKAMEESDGEDCADG